MTIVPTNDAYVFCQNEGSAVWFRWSGPWESKARASLICEELSGMYPKRKFAVVGDCLFKPDPKKPDEWPFYTVGGPNPADIAALNPEPVAA